MVKTISSPLNEDIMSTLDKLIEKGKIEGEQIGINKEKIDTILTLKEDRLPLAQIAKYVRLSEEEVNKILKDKGIN
jgi:predicted transposase YdaD